MKSLIFSFFLAATLTLPVSAQALSEAQFLETEPLVIQTETEQLQFRVEIADEPSEIATGMMFRDGLEENAGMLFDFGAPREANMFMRNVTFPLDMLFLASDGEILAIASHAAPGSERIINPGFVVRAVLELDGGSSLASGIDVGDRVVHRLFGSPPSQIPEPTIPENEPTEME